MRSLLRGLSLLTLLLAVGSGCASTAGQTTEPKTLGPVEVSLSTTNDVSRFSLGEYKYKVHLQKITDSRCPANAKCIWSGELAAELDVDREVNGKKDSKAFTLGQETMPTLTALGATFELMRISETTLEFRMTLEPRLK
ncbi:MAG: hypothetical protein WC538_05200 [Thermoanaerobaculia bacterium]|jgi:hypothetical protein